MSFTPCSTCRRHVRVDATECPFCGASAPGAHAPATHTVRARLTRGAIFTLGASAVIVGCGSEQAIYGAPAPDTGTVTDGAPADTGAAKDAGTDADAEVDTGTLAGAYGLPPDTGTLDTGTLDAKSD